MRLGLLGLPQSGKTSVFRILTRTGLTEPLVTHQPTVGLFTLPDPRLEAVARWANCERQTPATLEIWDPPSQWVIHDRTAARLFGELRTMDGLIHTVRAFATETPSPDEILHQMGDTERTLMMADLQVLEARYQRLQQEYAKRHDEALLKESQYVSTMMRCLQRERPLRAEPWPQEALQAVSGYGLLSLKPLLHLINLGERHWNEGEIRILVRACEERFPSSGISYTSARLELELMGMTEEERREWQQVYGLTDLLPERVVRPLLAALRLVVFYTVVGGEARAWLLTQGETALQAAGRIHTDMARGFIRAEVLNVRDIRAVASFQEARRTGRVRQEGRDYVVQDGDILTIRFSV